MSTMYPNGTRTWSYFSSLWSALKSILPNGSAVLFRAA